MFGLEYVLALIKVLFQIAFVVVTALPAKWAWNCIAPIYLSFMPEVYQHIPYWHVVSIFLVCTFVGEQIKKLTPKFVSVTQTNEQIENKNE